MEDERALEEFDLSKHIRESRNSLQVTVYDLSRLYENCEDTPSGEIQEELDRIIDALSEDAQHLRLTELKYACGSLR